MYSIPKVTDFPSPAWNSRSIGKMPEGQQDRQNARQVAESAGATVKPNDMG